MVCAPNKYLIEKDNTMDNSCQQCAPGFSKAGTNALTSCTPDNCAANSSGEPGTIDCQNGATATGTTGTCACACANGFSGALCHECSAGKGFDAQSLACEACAHPQINNVVTQRAACADQSCGEGYGVTSDSLSWNPTGGNCEACGVRRDFF